MKNNNINEKGFTLKFVLIFIAIFIVMILIAFTLLKNKNDAEATVINDFYQELLNGGVEFDKYLSNEFIRRISQGEVSHNEIFLCTSDFKENFELKEIKKRDNYFSVITNIPNTDIEVYTIKEDDKWKIDVIACIINGGNEIAETDELKETHNEAVVEEEIAVEKKEISYSEKFKVPVERAKKDLSLRTGINGSEILVVDVQAVVFSDSSLGTSKPGESYSQVLTPGYVVVLSINNVIYQYHLDESMLILINS